MVKKKTEPEQPPEDGPRPEDVVKELGPPPGVATDEDVKE